MGTSTICSPLEGLATGRFDRCVSQWLQMIKGVKKLVGTIYDGSKP
jgi:hypothetical protein